MGSRMVWNDSSTRRDAMRRFDYTTMARIVSMHSPTKRDKPPWTNIGTRQGVSDTKIDERIARDEIETALWNSRFFSSVACPIGEHRITVYDSKWNDSGEHGIAGSSQSRVLRLFYTVRRLPKEKCTRIGRTSTILWVFSRGISSVIRRFSYLLEATMRGFNVIPPTPWYKSLRSKFARGSVPRYTRT